MEKMKTAEAKNGPLLSVVAIGKNEEKNLPALFASLPAGERVEWIFVDSASNDNSAALAKELNAKVFVIEKDSAYAPGTGRYVGTLEARGRYILYLDGDMSLRPEFKPFLEQVLEAEKLPPLAAAFTGRTINRYLDRSGREVARRDYAVLPNKECGPPESFGRPAGYHGGAVLYLKSAVLEAGNWDPALLQLEEIDLFSRVRAAGGKLYAVDLPMVDHNTPHLGAAEKLAQNFLPVFRGKKLYGAGQALAAAWRGKRLLAFARAYPYPFIVLGGLIAAIPLLFTWPPGALLLNIAIFAWLALTKRWYYYLVYLGNIFQALRGVFRYRPFKPRYRSF